MDDATLPAVRIEQAILLLRGERVILDSEIAALYGVETKALVRSVLRNRERFPADFMFQLNDKEFADLRYQFGTSSSAAAHGGRRYCPYAFTEQGVAMLSGVLRSPRAIQVNVEIMRAFVRLRRLAGAHAELARKLDDLERRYDGQFKMVFDALRALMAPAATARKAIGFGAAPD